MKKIHIVEDEKYIIDGLLFVFRNKGMECSYSINGKEAMEWLKTNETDVILTDLEMPTMSGFELIKELRKTEQHKNTPIFAYTGYVDNKHFDEAQVSGVTEILAKPLVPDEVYKAISKYL